MGLSKTERNIILEAIREVEEVHYEFRKGKSQGFYVGEVTVDAEYMTPCYNFLQVPSSLVGLYKMPYATDLSCTCCKEALEAMRFERCERVEVVTYTYK